MNAFGERSETGVYVYAGSFVAGAYGIHAAGHMPLVIGGCEAVFSPFNLFVFSTGTGIVGNLYTVLIHIGGNGCRMKYASIHHKCL